MDLNKLVSVDTHASYIGVCITEGLEYQGMDQSELGETAYPNEA